MSNTPRQVVLNDAIKRRVKSPCCGCTERHSICHSSCDRYAEYKEQIKNEKAKAYRHYLAERKLEVSNIKNKQAEKKKRGRGADKKWSDYK